MLQTWRVTINPLDTNVSFPQNRVAVKIMRNIIQKTVMKRPSLFSQEGIPGRSLIAACTPLQMIHMCIDLLGGVSHFFTILVINMGPGRPSIWTQPGTQYGSWNLHRSAFGLIFPALSCNCFSKVLTTDSQEQQDYIIKFFSDWRCLLRTILIFNGPSILTCVVLHIYMSSPSSLFRAT